MSRNYIFFIFLISTCAYAVAADLVVSVRFQAENVEKITKIGATNVEGIGQISLIAERSGSRVFIKAVGEGGNVFGRAESVVGLKETPIYVSTNSGLQKVMIVWGSE